MSDTTLNKIVWYSNRLRKDVAPANLRGRVIMEFVPDLEGLGQGSRYMRRYRIETTAVRPRRSSTLRL